MLEQTERLPSLLASLAEAGVKGTTVIDTVGMGRILADSDQDGALMQSIRGVLASAERRAHFAIDQAAPRAGVEWASPGHVGSLAARPDRA